HARRRPPFARRRRHLPANRRAADRSADRAPHLAALPAVAARPHASATEAGRGDMTGRPPDPKRWKASDLDLSAAVETFLEQARALPSDRWEVPRAPDKWSPAQ